MARTAAAYESLVTQMTARSVTRVYSALVWGIPASVNGVIDAPIGRDHRDVTRMAVVVDGRASRTHYALEQSFHTPREASLLECRLETGRTHQIRVHLAEPGPISVRDIATRTALPQPYLEQILLALKGAGLICMQGQRQHRTTRIVASRRNPHAPIVSAVD
ncbi:MAG: hypothetical protein EB005_00350 [Actinobacteria bacterium]|nr:hypothetical protein [Actinomycetota bacterium]